MRVLSKITVLAALFGALAGCNDKEVIDPLAGGGGLAGEWVSGDNVFTAQFVNGNFLAVANDTGSKLSEGSYTVISASEVRMNWLGVVSGQNNAAVCQRPDASRMNCTDQTGKTFTLKKKGA
ncbi:MAG: hypothetical protein AB8B49_05145 [Nitratireductor sp.]